MALITCPECGKQVSDRAAACPSCGCPLQETPPAPVPPVPPVAPVMQQQPEQRVVSQELKCALCGELIQTKDLLNNTWAHCPSCDRDFIWNATGFDKEENIERIFAANLPKNETVHQWIMQHLMDVCPKDIFDSVRPGTCTCKFFWVREFGQGQDSALYPLCNYGKQLFRKLSSRACREARAYNASQSAPQRNQLQPAFRPPVNQPVEPATDYLMRFAFEHYFPFSYMVRFSSNQLGAGEFIPRELSDTESKYEFEHTDKSNYTPQPFYYCIPVYEEEIQYNGKKYTISGFFREGREPLFDFDGLPTEPLLEKGKQPNWFTAMPVTILAASIVFIVVLLIVIAAFAKGFWNGVGCIIVLGIVGALLGWLAAGAIGIVTMGTDKVIQLSINRGRRSRFLNEIEDIQSYKQQVAKQRLNLNLTYKLPQISLP